MADSGERRMLFDIRGRRKNVVRVVYAVLALLMGGSLFLTVGPFSIGEFIGGSGTSSAAEVLEEQAERVEGRLVKDPKNEALLLTLARTRIATGNALSEENPETGGRIYPPEARAEFEAAQVAWNQYLKQAGNDPNPSAAQLIASTNFSQAESGGTLEEIDANLSAAAKAQKAAAEARPSVGSLSTLAFYQYFAGDFAAGDESAKQAEGKATSKPEAKAIEKQLADYRKRAEAWDKQRQELSKQIQKQGKEELQNPLGGLSGGGLTP
jgi:hypothetical protein